MLTRSRCLPAAILLSAFALVGFSFYQLSVPDIEAAERAVWRGFDELERLDAFVLGEKGAKLGNISKSSYDQESLGNPRGAGSAHKQDGLFNTYSKFGGAYHSTSAFSSSATNPPKIVVERNGKLYEVGVLSVNKYVRTGGQRINPYLLRAWLESK